MIIHNRNYPIVICLLTASAMETSVTNSDSEIGQTESQKSTDKKTVTDVSLSANELLNAVKNHDAKDIKRILEAGADVNSFVSAFNSTALHVILSEGCYNKECCNCTQECVQLLLDAGANPNVVNAFGKTPLDVAVDSMAPPELIRMVIDYGATFVEKDGIDNRPLAKKLAKQMPDEFNHMLDQAVKFTYDGKWINGKRKIQLDWRYIVYNTRAASQFSGKWRETEFLNDVLSMGGSKHKILTHPLIAAFLKLKGTLYWWKFGFFYCAWIISTFILYMVFVWNLYNKECAFDVTELTTTPSSGDEDATSGEIDHEEGMNCHMRLAEQGMAYAILFMFVFGPLMLELRKLQTLGLWTYSKQWQIYVFIPTTVFVVLTLWPALLWDSELYLSWEYPCAAIGMLIASFSIMIQMTPITFIVLYAEMLFKVFIRIVIASIGFSPLFLGFFYGFRILLTNEKIGAFKLLTMVVSDVDYEELMDSDRGFFYDMIAYTFFTAFIILLVIVVLNFLIGLAVNDIQELQLSARATRFCNMVRSYYIMDAVYDSYMCKNAVIERFNEDSFVFEFDPLDPCDSRLPGTLKMQLLELARSRCCCCHGDSKHSKASRAILE